MFSVEPLKPQLSKISPAAGLKRLFSKQALANFAKGLVKLALIGAVIAALLWPQRHRLDGLVATDPAVILPFTRSLAMQMLGAVVAILALVAAADYLFQYRQWFERQKMSVREMKEEFRQTEGDPAVKGKIRQLRQARMRKRMMAAVPKASVVITNPTHFAVALQIRARHECAGLRRQGRRPDRAQDPRGGAASTTSRWSRTRRSPARCTPRSRSTRKSRPSITGRSPKSSATSCGCAARSARSTLRQAVRLRSTLQSRLRDAVARGTERRSRDDETGDEDGSASARRP